MSDTLPSGLLLLSHPEQIGITPKEMTDALPDAYKRLPRHTVEIDIAEIARQAIRSQDWGAAERVLEELFQAEVKPLRDKFPDYRLVYFGSSSVPLTIHLGFLLGTWQSVEIIPHHHGQRAWRWVSEPERPPPRLVKVDLPDYTDRTEGQAIVRVSTSHRVDPHATKLVVPNPLLEIDIALEQPAEDAFGALAEMKEVAEAWRAALDLIGNRFTGVRQVHLFASVQPGMALLLGAQINRTMHPAVQTYQYARNAENAPFHAPALLINGPRRPELPPLTTEQETLAGQDRARLTTDLERMKGLANHGQRAATTTWIARLLAKHEGHPEFSGMWRTLPELQRTPLPRTRIDVATRAVDDSFRLSPSNDWQLGDHWLSRLAHRIPEDAKRQRALRLLVLHESVHRGPQGLTRTLSQGIGRFPKVLEEMDYHADVWAMLYEHALTGLHSPGEIKSPQDFFKALVRLATETMWAFDDDGTLLREIQVRRLNRYLIWYWQYLLLERGTGQGEEMTLDAVLSLLAQRPTIELAGPTVLAHDERVFLALDAARMATPELAIYSQGRLYRHGERLDFSIAALLDGVRTRDGDKIIDVLRAAVEQTAR
jgi:hypothetical protein